MIIIFTLEQSDRLLNPNNPNFAKPRMECGPCTSCQIVLRNGYGYGYAIRVRAPTQEIIAI